MAAVICNAVGEMQSLAMYSYENIVDADGKPNLLGADDAVIVEIPNNATEDQLKTVMQPVVAELQANPARRVIVRYGDVLLPAATAITEADVMVAAMNANPLTVNDPDSKWVARVQVYCRLSNGIIQSAVGDVTGYELATTEAMNAGLAGKQNTTADPGTGYDLNNLHTTGTYNIINAQNAPVSGWVYVDVIKFTGGAGWVSQFVYTLGSDNAPNRIFHRNGMNTSDWSPWVELWHSGNFDPATKMTLLPYSLEEQLVPGEFWPDFDGVLRQVYIRSFRGPMSVLLADKQLLHNVKEVQYVRGGLGEAELFVPPYPQYFSAGSQWGYLVLGNNLIIDLQDENWNAAMQYNLTFKYTKA